MATSTTSSPFTRAVVSAIENVYPDKLADHTFDNTGLLLEAPFDQHRQPQKNSVLLANDLTSAIADEAIERNDSVVVAYR
jgi:putative NIF3 family GTP cyclohydrolase 1 type 2